MFRSLAMPEPSQPHNAVHTETLGGLQLSTSQEAVDFESSDVLYAEDAYKLGVLHGGNSNETVEVISVTMAHVLIIFLGGHTASPFI